MKKIVILILLISLRVFSQQSALTDTIQPTVQALPTEILTDTVASQQQNTQQAVPKQINNQPQTTVISNTNSSYTTTTSTTTSTPVTTYSENARFSDGDLQQINNLLTEAQYNSPLFDNDSFFVINDNEIPSTTTHIVDTDLLKSRLAEINATTPFHLEYNQNLEKVINYLLKYRRKYYPAIMSRAKYYFPIFEQYLDIYNIPDEMKYLAIIESALRPTVKSRVGATGIWQFMHGTGKQFKLAINSYVDERQDPVKSTIAACKYLSQLHDIFGDWDLALAAYNSGPGNVMKAIKRSGGYRNFWNIRHYLPQETSGYVPTFYATMYVFKYADELELYPNKPDLYFFETDTVEVKHTVSFDQIGETIGVSNDVLEFLNPKYKIEVIPYVKNKNFSVRLPRNKVVDFLDKEQQIYDLAKAEEAKREKPLPKYTEIKRRMRYKVRNGDYLGKIARRFGVKVRQLQRWNNMKNTKLSIGQKLIVYPRKM